MNTDESVKLNVKRKGLGWRYSLNGGPFNPSSGTTWRRKTAIREVQQIVQILKAAADIQLSRHQMAQIQGQLKDG
jgi:hypothetical protein